MAEEHGFEHVVVAGIAKLRCTVCSETGDPWEWPLARRHQHALAHAGVDYAVEAEQAIEKTRTDLEAENRGKRRRAVPLLPPRRCANPFCSVLFQPRRRTGRYCSTRCRVAAHRTPS